MPSKQVPLGAGVNTAPSFAMKRLAMASSVTKPCCSSITQLQIIGGGLRAWPGHCWGRGIQPWLRAAPNPASVDDTATALLKVRWSALPLPLHGCKGTSVSSPLPVQPWKIPPPPPSITAADKVGGFAPDLPTPSLARPINSSTGTTGASIIFLGQAVDTGAMEIEIGHYNLESARAVKHPKLQRKRHGYAHP